MSNSHTANSREHCAVNDLCQFDNSIYQIQTDIQDVVTERIDGGKPLCPAYSKLIRPKTKEPRCINCMAKQNGKQGYY